VEVRSRVKGFLEKRHFEEGADVEEGQLLYTIDRRTFEADVKVFEAKVAQAASREQLARREEQRLQALVGRNLISQSDYDRANEELTAARAALRLAEAEMAKARLELSFTEIRSPMTGVIGRTVQDEGSFVDEQNNSLLATVQRLDPIHVLCGVSEREYLLYRDELDRGIIQLASGYDAMRIRIRPANSQTFDLEGAVDFEDAGFNIQTGIAQVRALFPNAERSLRPGQFVKVRIVGYERPGSIAIPQKAVTMSPLGGMVFVINGDNVLEPRPIKLGRMAGDLWLVESGLSEGERIMVEGLMKTMGPGTKVNPVAVDSPEAQQVLGAYAGAMGGSGAPPTASEADQTKSGETGARP
jgi:membrane fusion protein (multidrug efflux system)